MKKLRRRAGYVIHSPNIHYKRENLQQLKGMQNSTLGIWNVYHLSIESIRTKGVLFCPKWYRYIKGTGLASTRSLIV